MNGMRVMVGTRSIGHLRQTGGGIARARTTSASFSHGRGGSSIGIFVVGWGLEAVWCDGGREGTGEE